MRSTVSVCVCVFMARVRALDSTPSAPISSFAERMYALFFFLSHTRSFLFEPALVLLFSYLQLCIIIIIESRIEYAFQSCAVPLRFRRFVHYLFSFTWGYLAFANFILDALFHLTQIYIYIFFHCCFYLCASVVYVLFFGWLYFLGHCHLPLLFI